ncbi:lipoic acid synthetase [Buchnera aphidicola str. Bp (Baizongia pistaciae)]|uniref:Lipoyl synthase n=1 Tax=Buchnera aphidicola subsp. Baizongia pistaciae (strain Bp) TaxID=224915 RepID=LIPA_BUCBP|nr:lipoyl synthase [Buchnera aphidicola]Q89AL7.1 RecName: Full=Lipoyl synthase; AltName: Full=Lip-syn; Short=LS; AltName: Full=Lipoate synthase; AltName: Full=Lipoic acid synthase; AltName: Full=Sulfur insertion protein LipA [Buchnera aphidicola str. Bp (Baizongia pistaciae)]AAO26977.1 lipoic acid synthetase [Buchnera aphidicola str. Bp (Baizongia pistaciae)]
MRTKNSKIINSEQDIFRNKVIPIKFLSNYNNEILKKPQWMKIKFPVSTNKIKNLTLILRQHNLNTVCEQALCPNLAECFNRGTATFMILGSICTRRCPFCAVSHGKPSLVNKNEPQQLARVIFDMKINYVVITSVVRDDLKDRGAQHFSNCIQEIRNKNNVKIEILVPDFRGMMRESCKIISMNPPNVFNHNLENVPRLYKLIRPGASYIRSLKLLEFFKKLNPNVPTKSGLILGLGETYKEIVHVINDLLDHGVTILTIGQYLQPSSKHFPVQKYITPDEFKKIKNYALSIGFKKVFCGPLIRSSYHAEKYFE